jgi:hypothetical protein
VCGTNKKIYEILDVMHSSGFVVDRSITYYCPLRYTIWRQIDHLKVNYRSRWSEIFFENISRQLGGNPYLNMFVISSEKPREKYLLQGFPHFRNDVFTNDNFILHALYTYCTVLEYKLYTFNSRQFQQWTVLIHQEPVVQKPISLTIGKLKFQQLVYKFGNMMGHLGNNERTCRNTQTKTAV